MAGLSPEQLEALLNGPAMKPPPGVIPQLDNPPNFLATSLAIPIVCVIISTAALAMRLYTRSRVLRKVDFADYSLIIAWAVFMSYLAMAFQAGTYAPGIHQWDLRLKNLSPFLYYVTIGSVLYGITIFFIKLSILLQYMHIFMPVREPAGMYWTSVSLIAANLVFYLVSSFLEIFSCSPRQKAWDPLVKEGSCIDILSLNIAASSINSVSDVVILVLPQVIIWRLNTTWKHRLGISAIFLVATFACVSSIVRLYYTVQLRNSHDITYYTWFAGVWTLPEMGLGIVVACLPVTRAFFVNVGQTRFLSSVSLLLKSWTAKSRTNLHVPAQRSHEILGEGDSKEGGGAFHAHPGIVPHLDGGAMVPVVEGGGGGDVKSPARASWAKAYGLHNLTAISASESMVEAGHTHGGIWTGVETDESSTRTSDTRSEGRDTGLRDVTNRL